MLALASKPAATLPEFMLRRMMRRGEFARALRHAGCSTSLEILSGLGMHLSVLERRTLAWRPAERSALALALASVGELREACEVADGVRASMRPAERRAFAAAVATWSPDIALKWLPADAHAERVACLAAADYCAEAESAFAAVERKSLKRPQEWFALKAMLAGRRHDRVAARRAIDDLFRAQGWQQASLVESAGKVDAVKREAPQVSVIMPARNAVRTIERAIVSILRQSLKKIELIVVDDASADGTAEAALAAANGDPRVTLVRANGTPVGPAQARNRGLDLATAAYAAFQDADDWSHPQRLERAAAALGHAGAMALVSSLVRIDEQGIVAAPRIFPLVRLNPSSLVFRREPVIGQIGGFDPVKTGSDIEYISRIVARFGHKGLIRDPNVSMLVSLRPGSLSFGSESAINQPSGARDRIAYREQWIRRQAKDFY